MPCYHHYNCHSRELWNFEPFNGKLKFAITKLSENVYIDIHLMDVLGVSMYEMILYVCQSIVHLCKVINIDVRLSFIQTKEFVCLFVRCYCLNGLKLPSIAGAAASLEMLTCGSCSMQRLLMASQDFWVNYFSLWINRHIYFVDWESLCLCFIEVTLSCESKLRFEGLRDKSRLTHKSNMRSFSQDPKMQRNLGAPFFQNMTKVWFFRKLYCLKKHFASIVNSTLYLYTCHWLQLVCYQQALEKIHLYRDLNQAPHKARKSGVPGSSHNKRGFFPVFADSKLAIANDRCTCIKVFTMLKIPCHEEDSIRIILIDHPSENLR